MWRLLLVSRRATSKHGQLLCSIWRCSREALSRWGRHRGRGRGRRCIIQRGIWAKHLQRLCVVNSAADSSCSDSSALAQARIQACEQMQGPTKAKLIMAVSQVVAAPVHHKPCSISTQLRSELCPVVLRDEW